VQWVTLCSSSAPGTIIVVVMQSYCLTHYGSATGRPHREDWPFHRTIRGQSGRRCWSACNSGDWQFQT